MAKKKVYGEFIRYISLADLSFMRYNFFLFLFNISI